MCRQHGRRRDGRGRQERARIDDARTCGRPFGGCDLLRRSCGYLAAGTVGDAVSRCPRPGRTYKRMAVGNKARVRERDGCVRRGNSRASLLGHVGARTDSASVLALSLHLTLQHVPATTLDASRPNPVATPTCLHPTLLRSSLGILHCKPRKAMHSMSSAFIPGADNVDVHVH